MQVNKYACPLKHPLTQFRTMIFTCAMNDGQSGGQTKLTIMQYKLDEFALRIKFVT